MKVNLRLLAVAEAMGKAPPSNLVKPVAPEKDMFYLQPLQNTDAAAEEENDDDDEDEDEDGDGKVAGMLSRQQHKLDPESADFRSLPPEMQHELLLEHVEWMKQQAKAASHSAAVSSDSFSTHQIDHVVARNKIAERIGELRKVLKRGGKERQGDYDVQILKCGDDSEIVFTKQISNVEFSVLDTRGKNKRRRVKSSSGKKKDPVKIEVEDVVVKKEDIAAEMRKLLFSSNISESSSSSDQDDNNCGNDFDSDRVTRNTLGLSTGHPGTFLNPYHYKKSSKKREDEEDPYDISSSGGSDLDDVTLSQTVKTTVPPKTNESSTPIPVKPPFPAAVEDRPNKKDSPPPSPTRNQPSSSPTSPRPTTTNQSPHLVRRQFSTTTEEQDTGNQPKSLLGVVRQVVGGVTERVRDVVSPNRVSPKKSDLGTLDGSDPGITLEEEEREPIEVSPEKYDLKAPKIPPKITQPTTSPQKGPNSPTKSPNLLTEMPGRRLEDLHGDLTEELDSLRQEHRKEMAKTETVDRENVADIKKLLEMFGLPYIVVPGEAEAQCATLCNLSLCDGVITDDSDIFLFGDVSVYKDVFKKDRDIMEFSSAGIQNNLGLSRDQLKDLAQIVGSDYCAGVTGMGCKMGHDLLTTHGSITHFLSLSRPSKYSRFSFEGLPNTAAVEAYLQPTVDNTSEPFSWTEPDVDQIVGYLGRQLSWSGEKVRTDLAPVLKELRSEQTRIVQIVKVKGVSKSEMVKKKTKSEVVRKKGVVKKGRSGRVATQPPLEKRARVVSSETMGRLQLELHPSKHVHYTVFREVTNAPALLSLIKSGKCASLLLNESNLLSPFHLGVAINKALSAEASGKMKSRSVMTEIVLCLSLVNGISQSLNTFGLKPDTTGIVAVTLGENEGEIERQISELKGQVEGVVIAEEDHFGFVESEKY
eukprot:sb/3479768/